MELVRLWFYAFGRSKGTPVFRVLQPSLGKRLVGRSRRNRTEDVNWIHLAQFDHITMNHAAS
jgi:hypothetical protein